MMNRIACWFILSTEDTVVGLVVLMQACAHRCLEAGGVETAPWWFGGYEREMAELVRAVDSG